ncbi:TonB-dependent receptor [Teredinibacter turnerae]|uniref:TonB-dependent receptor n=1 Tax=Teredinibacter turnerae TaxID=2426 RepID=UPI00036BAD7A|nr:TonB-dependent receptor [Teredinibacter turnerae]
MKTKPHRAAFGKKPLQIAIASVIAGSLSQGALAQKVEEMVVTATKQPARAQDTPIAIQALGASAMEELNIQSFDDYVANLPNVSAGGRGPGQSTVYIRGMSIQPITVMLSGAQGTTPNVALYLDEQPVTAPGRNLDVYAADMERIEVLAGPQGTLFGSSSQAGTIRLITNKPNFDGFDTGFKTSWSETKGGDMSTSAEAFVNLPINDKLATRFVVYNNQQGGYIDNVVGTFSIDPSKNPDANVSLPANATYEDASNVALAEDDFNDSFYKGMRIGAKYLINDDWDILVQHSRQELGADGVFDYDPEVGDLEVERFFPDELRDSFDQTAWTLEGRLGALEMLYTGAYLNRDVQQSIDYTGYNNSGGFIEYYTCTYDNPDYMVNYPNAAEYITDVRECKNPVKGFKGTQNQTRETHEFRIVTPTEKNIRAVVGVFYEDFQIKTQDDFLYLATPDIGFVPNAPIAGANNINDATRPAGVAFFNDITRTETQMAAFGEVAYDLLSNLTATVGLRYYEMESDFTGSSNFADGIFQNGAQSDRGRDYDSSGGHTKEPLKADDVITKFNLSYRPSTYSMVYFTYSEGFRPGGFNRGGGIPSANPDYPTVSVTYETDNVVNREIGWKTQWFDQSLQFNGNIYNIQWNDMQVSRFDPENVSILTFIENAADAEITGLEADLTWAATNNLTLFAAMSYNDSELKSTEAQVIEMAPVGSQLPLTPKLQFNLRARYAWSMGLQDYYVQLGSRYSDKSYSSIVAEEREEQHGYTLVDASIGTKRDGWNLELFVDNLTDKRAEMFINNQDDIRRIGTNRPRTAGLRVSYRYQ